LIDQGLEDAVADHWPMRGERAGVDLKAIITKQLLSGRRLDGLHSRYPQFVVEQAAIAGALNPECWSGRQTGRDRRRLHRPPSRSSIRGDRARLAWRADPDGGLIFTREVRGVREVMVIDAS
jgi:DNA gyrase subunit B